jgi:hypothetical protein
MNTDEIPQQMLSHENDLRVIGQALEALGIESFELTLDGDNFVVHGGPELAPREKPLTPNRLQRFEWTRRKKVKPQQSRFFISGMRFRESDVIRLDRQGKDIRLSPERCPDTNSLSHSLRMIGAHIDKKGGILLRVIRYNRLFTVWHKSSLGPESKEIFTQSNLYDLWVHLYKKRRNVGLKRNGTTRNGL